MPYVRKARAFRKKGFRKGRKVPWYRKKYSAMDAGRLALSQIWKLKGLVNSEMYKLDTVWTPGAITNGQCSHLTGVAQGDSDSARTGNSIFVRSYNFNGVLTHNVSGQNSQVVRVAIVMDTQQVGDSSPTYSSIYESISPYAHLNSDTVGRYKVIWSRIYTVNTYDKNNAIVKINIPMRHHVRYNGTASSDIQKGGLYMCVACDEAGANMPTFAGEHRLSYHDN